MEMNSNENSTQRSADLDTVKPDADLQKIIALAEISGAVARGEFPGSGMFAGQGGRLDLGPTEDRRPIYPHPPELGEIDA